MTDSERLLEALRRGPQTADALYRLGLMVHSRAADLRRKGHVITCSRIPGEKGAKSYVYTWHGHLAKTVYGPETLAVDAVRDAVEVEFPSEQLSLGARFGEQKRRRQSASRAAERATL